jgi:hypothetical protein
MEALISFAWTFSNILGSIVDVEDYYSKSVYLLVEFLLIGEVLLGIFVLLEVVVLLSGVFFLKKSVILGVFTNYYYFVYLG